MAKTASVSEKQLDRARGSGKGTKSLKIEVSEEFLWWINAEATARRMTNRDFVIEALIRSGREEF